MSQHLSIDTILTGLGAGSLSATVLLATLVGAVLLVWFPPPLSGFLRRVRTRLGPAVKRAVSQQDTTG